MFRNVVQYATSYEICISIMTILALKVVHEMCIPYLDIYTIGMVTLTTLGTGY